MKKVIIIPARFGSSRYKGKPLVKILKREMILRVADICANVVNLNDLYIATDSEKISNVVKSAGYKTIMTSSSCLTGTDRVAEASRKINSNIYINVQGDEPTINPRDIRKVINAKVKYPKHVICGYDNVHKFENPHNINLPKVVLNKHDELIYISRAAIPSTKKNIKNLEYLKQVCIYGFTKSDLSKFYSKKKSYVESLEDIEILRFFDLKMPIKMVKVSNKSVSVDVKKDLEKVTRIIKKNERN